ncbi:ANTAR domain-containing protein, partial [Streptomyces chromofuscus]|uniref:ANTAR domain-containing protein n=1 Tax=Streptomyces chromofuscus TaxID=42881 RepID=UPI001E59E3E1
MSQLSWHSDQGYLPESPPARDTSQQTAPLSQAELDVRNRTIGQSGVARAQGVLLERYRLTSADQAFELLKTVSQRSNIKLHTLADAVLRTPAPDPGEQVWFPRRARYSPPRLPGVAVDHSARGSQGAVLKAVLDRVLSVTQAPMGNVQLAESGRLRLARHTGLNKYFTDFFA